MKYVYSISVKCPNTLREYNDMIFLDYDTVTSTMKLLVNKGFIVSITAHIARLDANKAIEYIEEMIG